MRHWFPNLKTTKILRWPFFAMTCLKTSNWCIKVIYSNNAKISNWICGWHRRILSCIKQLEDVNQHAPTPPPPPRNCKGFLLRSCRILAIITYLVRSCKNFTGVITLRSCKITVSLARGQITGSCISYVLEQDWNDSRGLWHILLRYDSAVCCSSFSTSTWPGSLWPRKYIHYLSFYIL